MLQGQTALVTGASRGMGRKLLLSWRGMATALR